MPRNEPGRPAAGPAMPGERHHAPWAGGPGRPVTVVALYLALFVGLDWVSYIRPLQGLNVTPWNPHPALAVSLLLWRPRAVAWVWMGLLLAEFVVRGAPADPFVTAMAAALVTLTYAAMARTLQARMDRSLVLGSRHDLAWFSGVVVLGALAGAVLYVGVHGLTGQAAPGLLVNALARLWVGDAVGMLVALPMLLLGDPQRRRALAATWRLPQWWLVAGLVLLLLGFAFARPDSDHFKFSYLLLLPVVWSAVRLGVAGAVMTAALTQVGLIVAVQLAGGQDLTVFELQVLMAALTLTGLLLAVTVDERERTMAELRGSLRMAAAGQMAAALAHELSQPLTALAGYAQAARLIVQTPQSDDAERVRRLVEVSQRMGDGALQAGAVVKRLREFFRSGSTQLQAVAPAQLLREAAADQQRRAAALGVTLEAPLDDTLPTVWVDPVQIAVVLRNLLANALEAAHGGAAPRWVRLGARVDERLLRVEVLDSGAGVDTARLQVLFDAGASDKPGGMGVGLGICRAIVEAHGGRLWAEPGPGGWFCFTLPRDGEADDPRAP